MLGKGVAATSLYKGNQVRFADLPRALACLPPSDLGATKNVTLEIWRKWYAQGALQLAWVESLDPDRNGEIQCLGVTLCITDHALAALVQPGSSPAASRVYAAEAAGSSGPSWAMTAADIRAVHGELRLNLLVLHFWTRRPPFEAEFQAVFLQSHTKFRDLHQGIGVQRLLQEVAPFETDILLASGLKILRAYVPDAAVPRVLLGLDRDDALAKPGSTLRTSRCIW